MKNFINWLFAIEEERIKRNLNDIFIENARFIINGSKYEPENFIHVSITGNYILNNKLAFEEELTTNSFKTRAKEIKEKFNYKFNKG